MSYRPQHELHAVVIDHELSRDGALFAPAQDVVEIVPARNRPMQVPISRRRLGETGIIGLHKSRQKCVRRFNGADACQPQLLHQPVLQRMMGPFHAALGLAGIGAQNLDVELRQSTAELGHAISAGGILPRYPKDRMLVGIERNRLAMVLQIALQSLEIGKRALGWDKAKLHQSAGGVIDEH
jgi:hypothetical protein